VNCTGTDAAKADFTVMLIPMKSEKRNLIADSNLCVEFWDLGVHAFES